MARTSNQRTPSVIYVPAPGMATRLPSTPAQIANQPMAVGKVFTVGAGAVDLASLGKNGKDIYEKMVKGEAVPKLLIANFLTDSAKLFYAAQELMSKVPGFGKVAVVTCPQSPYQSIFQKSMVCNPT